MGAEHRPTFKKKPSGQESHSICSKQILVYRCIWKKKNKNYSHQRLNTEWKWKVLLPSRELNLLWSLGRLLKMRNRVKEMEWVFSTEKIATPLPLSHIRKAGSLNVAGSWLYLGLLFKLWVSWRWSAVYAWCSVWDYVVQVFLHGPWGLHLRNSKSRWLCFVCDLPELGLWCQSGLPQYQQPEWVAHSEFIRWVSGKKITPFLRSVVLISVSIWGIGHIFLDRTCNWPWRKMMSPQIIMGLGSPKEETRWDFLSLNYVISRN